MQNDFMPGGALAVAGGDEIVEVVNSLTPLFNHVILTQDWHPHGHLSFASAHDRKDPFDMVSLSYGQQVLWPDHCVQGTFGAKLHSEFATNNACLVIRKGSDPAIDSYSTFYENDKKTATGLSGLLKERQVENIFLVGLATDFCVFYSAMDGKKLGFDVTVIEDACRGIDNEGSLAAALEAMESAGIKKIMANRLIK
jgi:nicotinamidase/pyrazinamidase